MKLTHQQIATLHRITSGTSTGADLSCVNKTGGKRGVWRVRWQDRDLATLHALLCPDGTLDGHD